jgi:hypothetical protein
VGGRFRNQLLKIFCPGWASWRDAILKLIFRSEWDRIPTSDRTSEETSREGADFKSGPAQAGKTERKEQQP